ncbi:MAG TPA: nuclear transport factor 2 family protein [Pyrinomonadaceae bacterium]|nr:nuclear transport factor 2 family protein [Pyrinomonadaceae bacterium]
MKFSGDLVVWICLLAGAMAQQNQFGSALQSLVDAERAFARTSEAQGTRPAFLAFIAEDGILFRPTATNGKKWMQQNPLPPSEKRPLLAWQPAFADIAQAGDMGYTFGPWEYKEDIKDEKPVAYGHFATVWKRQPDGTWKFVIDHGVSHPQPHGSGKQFSLPQNKIQKSWKPSKPHVESARRDLLDRDRQFLNASLSYGPVKAFTDYSSASVKLFRNGSYPFTGVRGITQVLGPKNPGLITLKWEPAGGDVSQSEDLGYTYGTYSVAANTDPQKPVERGVYMRVWKKEKDVWKVVLDVETEIKN